jgi:hypothetical protein
MQNGQPQFLTKAELRCAAMEELNASKNSFNAAWVEVIELTGPDDWHRPLWQRSGTRS